MIVSAVQVANDYERDVFNGDLGVITSMGMEEGALTVSFEGRPPTMMLSNKPIALPPS